MRRRTLDAADLTRAPGGRPEPAGGTNVELVVPLAEERIDGSGLVRMRVHERGVGETRSCGTGACAAALAVRALGGPGRPGPVVGRGAGRTAPGHRVRDGDRVELAGPAVLVATSMVDLAALKPTPLTARGHAAMTPSAAGLDSLR